MSSDHTDPYMPKSGILQCPKQTPCSFGVQGFRVEPSVLSTPKILYVVQLPALGKVIRGRRTRGVVRRATAQTTSGTEKLGESENEEGSSL